MSGAHGPLQRTHLNEIAIICGATLQPIFYLKFEALCADCTEGCHMLSDRRNLHLVNLDLVFLGQVLQVKTLTCFSKHLFCATGAQKTESSAW